MKVSRLHSILFLLVVVFAVYLPAISGNYNTIDDIHIISAYGTSGQRTLQQILLPANQFYYRPLIELTYYLDNIMWGLDPSFMHLENILIHALNVVLVYLLAAEVAAFFNGMNHLPFISALLFAIHPVHTEAISWIAGRTDPLAATFVLLSALFLLKCIQSGNGKHFVLYLAAMSFSFLVKETSFMMVPASFVLVYSTRTEPLEANQRVAGWLKLVCIVFGAAIVGYCAIRVLLKPSGSDNAVSILFQSHLDPLALISESVQAVGFYVTKFLYPLPLNFAINTVAAWYIVPGILSLVVSIWFLRKPGNVNSLFIVALIFLAPAVLVRITGITWTPVAERYLYIPSAFFTIWLSVILLNLIKHVTQYKILYVMLVLITCGVAFVTYQRNQIWRDNYSLYEDAVKKSPDFGDIHNEFGIALNKKGDYQRARKHFLLAQQLSKRPLLRDFAGLNLLNCDLQGKPLHEKREILLDYVSSHPGVQSEVLRMLRNVDFAISFTGNDPKQLDAIRKEMIVLNDRIFNLTRDPHCLYSNGQIMLARGNDRAALDYFRKTIINAPPNAYFYEPAKKLIHKLEDP
ncbi:glycosyltransferase family 39 protein [Geotalea sp. SG265]|uniref:glycosyltransferase family 39 protein n=1 Tax=Geotalea sp. SG265 TaxID=2922867 RepID=UPI001FAF13AA|nr:glycosyltransferase family 39 protein [Geotalea sp. SG265]